MDGIEKDVENSITAAVLKAENAKEAQHQMKSKSLELLHQQETLDMQSKLKSAEFEKSILSNQVNDLKAELKANRDAQVKMAEASNSSWKDEFWTIVLSVPLFCLGYSVVADDASIVDRVRYSFDVLSTLPDWYQYLLFLAVSASFGIRGADKLMKLRGK